MYHFKQQIEVLETKVKNFAEQLDRQYEMNKSADSRAKRVETDFYGLQEQIHKLEEELAAGEALRDGLRLDKDKVGWPGDIFYKLLNLKNSWNFTYEHISPIVWIRYYVWNFKGYFEIPHKISCP